MCYSKVKAATQLTAKLGVCDQAGAQPSLETLFDIADYLDIDVADLIAKRA